MNSYFSKGDVGEKGRRGAEGDPGMPVNLASLFIFVFI